MKKTKKKVVSPTQVQQPPVKQTSGDKAFDDAIDRMLKVRPQPTPSK
ncbi:hypothetical protein IM792_02940 [Mucilaginibacter sp. JRF]|nr:hypothetical protein [Mucilaginibacter sp. JRF]MBE9583392.1 hypothetical protein [Mucilaginibacter sp. JRF]